MSTGALYRAIGLGGYRHVATWDENGEFKLRLEPPEAAVRCPRCRSTDVVRRGTFDRFVHAPPIGLRKTVVFIRAPRVECRRCRTVRIVHLPSVVPHTNHTKSFARLVVDLRRMMTIQDIARYLGVSTTMIKSIDKRYLKTHYSKPKLKHVKVIAIDEISIRKGHTYLTIVMDLESGAIVFVGKGKGEKALKPFWKRLKSSHARIEAVATDMSSAYYAAVQTNLPQATLVFDRFHIVKLMNEKLSQLRRDLQREAQENLHKDVLKGTRWLLLKAPEHLDTGRNEQQRLQEALKLNESLATAYYLKEDLRQIWEQPHRNQAAIFLTDWCRRARASGIRVLQTMANTLEGYRSGILNWYRCRISTGPLEGTNNKIKTMNRQAYGYRDEEYLQLKLFALHESKFQLIG
jgi:transposase